MSSFQRLGIIGKRDAKALDTVKRLIDWLSQAGPTPVVDERLRGDLGRADADYRSREQIAEHCDLALVVGGDGTLLSAARTLAPRGVPILGINQGRLGFMVDVPPADLAGPITAILNGQYVPDQRLVLQACVHRGEQQIGPYYAINDVVIRNQASIRMLEFETWRHTQFISQHRADGMIVSTPTGSTAYALSSGGPVVHPALEALSLVPICPHTLSDRPLVVSADQPIQVVLQGGAGTRAMVTCDGQSHETLLPGDRLQIERAPFRLHLIHPAGYDYFGILRDKLHWGRAPA
jgi:NAD+ kinase